MIPFEITLKEIKINPQNPRLIKDAKFEKLKKSLKDFPEMMQIRPVVIDADGVILGGNMRYQAAKSLGWKKVWAIRADSLTEEQKREFIIKDNVGFGDWDWDILANEWDAADLGEWGLDVPGVDVVGTKAKEDNFEIVIDCENEDQQFSFFQKLKNQGYKCRKK